MQSCCEEDVEERAKYEHRHDEEGAVPAFICVCISIIEHQEALYDRAGLESDRCLERSNFCVSTHAILPTKKSRKVKQQREIQGLRHTANLVLRANLQDVLDGLVQEAFLHRYIPTT